MIKKISSVQPDGAAEMLFPMHCITIQDLLNFDKLPSYDQVKALDKFVVIHTRPARPVLFIRYYILITIVSTAIFQ